MTETYTHRQTPPPIETLTGHNNEVYGPPHPPPPLVASYPAMQLAMASTGPFSFRDSSMGMDPLPISHHQLPQMVPEMPP